VYAIPDTRINAVPPTYGDARGVDAVTTENALMNVGLATLLGRRDRVRGGVGGGEAQLLSRFLPSVQSGFSNARSVREAAQPTSTSSTRSQTGTMMGASGVRSR